ncbi:MAG: antitoxin [Acidimicrobiales bacterium]
MRTTVTLDPDVESLVQGAMRDSNVSFKTVVNQAIRAGLSTPSAGRFRQRTFALGARPEVNYDRALALAGALEDDEIQRKLQVGK